VILFTDGFHCCAIICDTLQTSHIAGFIGLLPFLCDCTNRSLGFKLITRKNKRIYLKGQTQIIHSSHIKGKEMADYTKTHRRPHNSGTKNRGPFAVRVRFPSLELFGLHHARALSIGKARRLNANELKAAQSVFGKSIDYRSVRILKASAVNSPTVLGNVIRTDDQSSFLGSQVTFIHEMTHVWQYQTSGTRYISNSVIQQIKEKITSEDVKPKIVPNASIYNYTVEEQAEIVSDYYAFTEYQKTYADLERKGQLPKNKKGIVAVLPILEKAGLGGVDEQVIERVKKFRKAYDRMIGQVRGSRPLPRKLLHDLILKETTWNRGIIKPPSERRDAQPNPMIRIEF
jgi:hypothetical protein